MFYWITFFKLKNSIRKILRCPKLLAVSIVMLTSTHLEAAQEQPIEIVKKAYIAQYGQDSGECSSIQLIISNKSGKTRHRELLLARAQADADAYQDQRYFIHFQKPDDVRGMRLLVWKQHLKEDQRWLYLPALSMVKRIAPSDARTRFAGSSFYYEDFTGRPLSADTFKCLPSNDEHYVISATPLDPKSVSFSHYIMTISKQTYLPMKISYYKDEAVSREYTVQEVGLIDSYPVAIQATMHEHDSGQSTKLIKNQIRFGQPAPISTFSERILRAPPQHLLNLKARDE